jgi:hypothetical protein
MFENTFYLSITLHVSLITLHILFALTSVWFYQIYAKPIFYLSAVHSMFLLFPESPYIINITNILQSCLELLLSLSNFSSATLFAANLSTASIIYKICYEFCQFISILPLGPHISLPYVVLDSLSISYIFSKIFTLMPDVVCYAFICGC